MGKLYSALVAAPSKILGAISTTTGFAAAFWPDWFANKIGTQVTADSAQQLGIMLLAIGSAYFFLLWWLKPGDVSDTGSTFNNPSGVNIGTVTGGDFSQHTHNAPTKFSRVFEVTTIPSFMGGNDTINLDGVATLRLFPPYSIRGATLALDATIMKQPDEVFPDGSGFRDVRITLGKLKTFTFDTEENKRHTMDVEGKVFIVTLRGTEALKVEDVAKPLKFVFSVKEA